MAAVNRRHKAAILLTLLAAGTSLIVDLETKQVVGIVLLGLAFAWLFGSNNPLAHSVLIVAGLSLTATPLWRDWHEYREERRSYFASVADFETRIPELAKRYPEFIGFAGAVEGLAVRKVNGLPPGAHLRPLPPNFSDALVPKQKPKYKYVKLPDGSYGKFRFDATDEEIIVAVERDLPGTFARDIQLPDESYVQVPLSASANQLKQLSERIAEKFPSLPGWRRDALVAGVNFETLPVSEYPLPEPVFSFVGAVVANRIPVSCGVLLLMLGTGTMLGVKFVGRHSTLRGQKMENQESQPLGSEAVRPLSWFILAFASLFCLLEAWATNRGNPIGALAGGLTYILIFAGIAYAVRGRRRKRNWNSFARWYFWLTIIVLSLMFNARSFNARPHP
jgi:hypothetical protein